MSFHYEVVVSVYLRKEVADLDVAVRKSAHIRRLAEAASLSSHLVWLRRDRATGAVTATGTASVGSDLI